MWRLSSVAVLAAACGAEVTPPSAGQRDDAAFFTFILPLTVEAGGKLTVRVTMDNNGTNEWTAPESMRNSTRNVEPVPSAIH